MADEFPDTVLVDGVAYKRHQKGMGRYHSLCGPLEVGRFTYRQMGVRNGPTIVPLELEAGLVEGATPALAYNVAHGYGQHDMRLHGEMLLMAHRQPPSRATLERLAKDIGTAAVLHAPRIEPLVRRGEQVPKGTVAVATGLDRTAVAMKEQLPSERPGSPSRSARSRVFDDLLSPSISAGAWRTWAPSRSSTPPAKPWRSVGMHCRFSRRPPAPRGADDRGRTPGTAEQPGPAGRHRARRRTRRCGIERVRECRR